MKLPIICFSASKVEGEKLDENVFIHFGIIAMDVEHALFDQIERIHSDPSFWNAN